MKKAKPLKCKLLRKVRKEITLKRINVCGLPMFAIDCNVSKSTLPSQTVISCILDQAKEVVRRYRIQAARELCPRKVKPEAEITNEIKV